MISSIWFMVVLCVIGIATPFVLKVLFPHRISVRELILSITLSMLVASIVIAVLMFGGKFDTEIHNGHVTSKAKERTSCEHSYQICSGSGSSKVCTTYYDHSHDYNWVVRTTVGTLHISRIDSQGTKEPPRFSKAKVNEPVALENSYLDYLKGIDNTLLYTPNVNKVTEFERLLPNYPRVYDYYRSKPVIFRGVNASSQERDAFNSAIRDMLKTLSHQKQVNVVVVIVNTPQVAFGEYLKNHWRNGRKNDQVIVIGAPEFPKVEWAYAFGWSKNQMVNKALQYDVGALEELTPDNLVQVASANIKESFVRRPMESFKSYLWETKLDWWKIILAAMVQIAANVGLAVWFYREDVL